jgi:hypothetical protein
MHLHTTTCRCSRRCQRTTHPALPFPFPISTTTSEVYPSRESTQLSHAPSTTTTTTTTTSSSSGPLQGCRHQALFMMPST